MDAKHTYGPWIDAGNAITTADGLTGIAIIDDCPSDDFWCDIERFPEKEERRANARLIAAAPDLFSACEKTAAMRKDCECEMCGPCMARAAIAKATGGN